MRSRRYFVMPALAITALLLGICPASAEVVEEIVAWVGGEIITKSDLEQAEEELVGELYRRFTGEELDQQVKAARDSMLQQLIDNKILYLRAGRLFDMEMMRSSFTELFMQQQNIETEEELTRLLAQEGMSLDAFKQRLVERFAPDEVLRLEVGNRVAVSDDEIEQFYNENLEEFRVETQLTIREIVLLAEDDNRDAKRQEAGRIHALAVAPEADFSALAEEHSEAGTKDQGGLLGPLAKSELSDALAGAATALQTGEVSEVLEMPHGFHIIKLDDMTEEFLQPLDEVGVHVKRFLENRKYVEEATKFLDRARAEIEWKVAPKYKNRMPQQS